MLTEALVLELAQIRAVGGCGDYPGVAVWGALGSFLEGGEEKFSKEEWT